MKKGAAGLFVLVVSAAAVALPIQWLELQPADTQKFGDVYKFCNKSVDPLIIYGLSLSPDPPQSGQQLAIRVTYNLTEKVSGGKIKIDATMAGYPLYSGTVDLCQVLNMAEMQCPIGPQPGRYSTTVDIPVLQGVFNASAIAMDDSGKELACLEVYFKL